MPDTTAPPFSTPIPTATLHRRRDIAIDTTPDPNAARSIADALGLLDLRKARLRGVLRPAGRDDWVLDARLGATATQPCVVTLAPVVTRIDTPVHRRFVADWHDLGPGEHGIAPDDETEPLGRTIDPGAILVEELALALPDYPRASDALPGQDTPGEPTHRPFADLQRKLAGDGGE